MSRQSALRLVLPGLLLVAGHAARAETSSEPAVVSEVITLAATGEATVALNASKTLRPGTTAAGTVLGTWSASVTAGTLAWRLTPGTVTPYTTPTWVSGFLTSTTDGSRQIEVSLTTDSACQAHTLSGQWRVCPQGVTAVSGSLVTVAGKTQTLVPGTYPVAVDAAVWSF